MNITQTLTCKYCNEIYKDPVGLNCCGGTICKKDIDELLSNGNETCPFCDHVIQNQTFIVIEPLKILIEQTKLHEFKINPELERLFKSFKEKIELLERMHNDPENIINTKFSELRRLVDLDRETAKLEIDRLADGVIKELDAYEIQFKWTCKSRSNLDYYDKLIQNVNKKLNEYEKCLNSLRSIDEDRTRTRREIKKAIEILDGEINDYENKMFNNKSFEYEPIANVSVLKDDFGKFIVKEIDNEGFLVSAGNDGKINIWDVKEGKLIKTLAGHTDAVTSLTYIKEMGYLASGSMDKTIKIWDVKEGKLVKTLVQSDSVCALGYMEENAYLVSSDKSDKGISIWDVEEGKLIKKIEGFTGGLLACIDENLIASGSNQPYGTIVWDVKNGKIFKSIRLHKHRIRALAYIKEMGCLASSDCENKEIMLWDFRRSASERPFKRLEGHILGVMAFAYIKENDYLASGGGIVDHIINIWDLNQRNIIKTLDGHTSSVTSLVYLKESGCLASGSKDTTIKLWDVKKGEIIKTLEGHTDRVTALIHIK